MHAERPSQPMLMILAVLLLLLLMAVLAGGAARHESVTIDEVAHVGAGVSCLQKLDLRLNQEHPPLAKVVAAVPLVLRGVHADYSHISWTFSGAKFNQFLGEWVFGHWLIMRWNNPYSTMFWARLPMLLLALLLGFVLYLYGSRLGGPWGGLLCLTAYVTMPVFLAFGPLVLTDIILTLFFLLTLWTFGDMWRSPTPATVLKFGFALAGALLSKFSAGVLFLCFLAFMLSLRLRPLPEQPTDKPERKKWRRTRWWVLVQGTLLAAGIVYAVYFVLSWNQPTDSLQVLHVPASPVLRRLLMPPWIFLRGLLGFALSSSRPTFILGRAYTHGVWFYFPALFFLKSPLTFIALLLLTLMIAFLAKRRVPQLTAVPPDMQFHWRAVWVFLLVYTAACLLSRLNLSIRHFSVPLALLILLLAPLPRMLQSLQRSGWRAARPAVWLTIALAVISVITAVRAYPYYFPFLNSFSMGHPAYALVNDSNLDWNQALPNVETFVQQRGLQHVLLDSWGFSEPEPYVPQALIWNCQTPSPADGGQWGVLSANMIQDGHNCLWLLRYPHETLAGGSVYAFHLPEIIPPPGTDGGPPLPADYHHFAGFPGDLDPIDLFRLCIRDPQQLQPTMDRIQAVFVKAQDQKKKQ